MKSIRDLIESNPLKVIHHVMPGVDAKRVEIDYSTASGSTYINFEVYEGEVDEDGDDVATWHQIRVSDHDDRHYQAGRINVRVAELFRVSPRAWDAMEAGDLDSDIDLESPSMHDDVWEFIA